MSSPDRIRRISLYIAVLLVFSRLGETRANKFESTDFSTPSIHWIEYQRERFSDSKSVHLQSLNRSMESSTIQETSNTPHSPILENSTENKIAKTTANPKSAKKSAKEGFKDSTQRGNQLQFPSIQGFFKFLKSLKRTWVGQSKYGIDEKISMLKKLKDDLMLTIENRIALLLRPMGMKRSKRGILEDSALNFPPEAALMSINFLTFAVFLIKLVLQVVHIIKSKHYSFSGFGVGTNTMMTNNGVRH